MTPRQEIEKRLLECQKDIRRDAFELLELALSFAQKPELQEFSQEAAARMENLASSITYSVNAMRENNDELDAIQLDAP